MVGCRHWLFHLWPRRRWTWGGCSSFGFCSRTKRFKWRRKLNDGREFLHILSIRTIFSSSGCHLNQNGEGASPTPDSAIDLKARLPGSHSPLSRSATFPSSSLHAVDMIELSRGLNGRRPAWLLRFLCSAWKVHKTPEESLLELFERLPIKVNARQKNQNKNKNPSGYEVHRQPLHQKSRIRKLLFTETPNNNKENIQCWSCWDCFRCFFFSPFFVFFSFFLFFFAILCSVIRKILSYFERHLGGGSGASGRRSPWSATDLSYQTVPVKKTIAVEPVGRSVASQGKWKVFSNLRLFQRLHHISTSTPGRRAGGRWCCCPPKVKQYLFNFL